MLEQRIERWVQEHRESILNMRQSLNELAEVSLMEFQTSTYIRERLEQLHIPYQLFDNHTGIVAWPFGPDKRNAAGRTVALRADMDALWQQTKDGWKAVHSCGHDAHMTMVLHAAQCLKDIGYETDGALKIIFQPAEETLQGAALMAASGVIDGVDCLLGVHLRPVQEMPDYHASPGIHHGSSGRVEAVIEGKAAHAARPHLGVNAADVLIAIGVAVNAVKMNPLVPSSAKITIMRTDGKAGNIIPDSGYVFINLRAQTNEAMEELIIKVTRAVEGSGHSYGANVTITNVSSGPAGIPDAWMEEVVGEAICRLTGVELHQSPVSPGSDDFHVYKKYKPDLHATMVGLGCGLSPGLHDPEMTFNTEALLKGTAILAYAAARLFEHPMD